MESDYIKYRGKCKEFCEEAVRNDPSLTLVRGWYWCPIWNTEEQHWWTKRPDGTIFDPTVRQFPSNGAGEYTEYNGEMPCEECGEMVKEIDFIRIGNYIVCSRKCGKRLVGI